MTLTYREIQNKLKVDRDLGLIPKTFKLNQKKTLLQAKVKTVKRKHVKAVKNLGVLLNNIPMDGNTYKINMKNTSLRDVVKYVKRDGDWFPLLISGDQEFGLTSGTRTKLLKTMGTNDNAIFKSVVNIDEINESDSDTISKFTGKILEDISIRYVDVSNKKNNKGKLFPYNHSLDNFNLERYQIYSNDKSSNYEHNCFVYSLMMWGELSPVELDYVKSLCKNTHIPQSNFITLSDKLKITIVVNKFDKCDNKRRKVKYGSGDRIVQIGLISEHYFFIESVDITRYCIDNYSDVKDLKEWWKISKKQGKYYKRNPTRMDSYDVVISLLKNKNTLLKEIDPNGAILDSSLYKQIDKKITNLDYIHSSSKPVQYVDKSVDSKGKCKVEPSIVYFDFETVTDLEKHVPYLCSALYSNDKVHTFFGNSCGLQFLSSLYKNTTVVVHNLGYDIGFLLKYLLNLMVIYKSTTKCIYTYGMFMNKGKKIQLTFICSYAMTDTALGKFSKTFKLKGIHKEILPYGAYNSETVKMECILISYAKSFLNKSDQEQFEKNIIAWDCVCEDPEFFLHIKYSQIYCEQDVKTTKAGYLSFRKSMKKITGLDIINYITNASISDAYLKKNGCYSGCVSLAGTPQIYHQRTVVGGRTMCNDNKMIHVKDVKIVPLDAKSLYPSAMYEMPGFLIGSPKVLESVNCNYEFLLKQDGYFIEVDITKINVKYKFSLLSEKNSDGIRVNSNDLLGVHYLNKYSLEDLIEFQKIEFTVVRGYYYNEGRNNKINSTIKGMYDERVKAKKDKDENGDPNPIQAVYKLLMNSSYGKSILKPIDTEIKIITDERYNAFIAENYNSIIEVNRIPDSKSRAVKLIKPTNDHFNCPQVGSEILSFSKRIMNRVMCLSEDLGIKMYYQDTDSIHMDKHSIPLLESEFKKKYGKTLIGEYMGQFGNDFDDIKHDKDTELYAVEAIYLGKKSYIEKVQFTLNGKIGYVNHIRMKGIPSKIILHKAKTDFDNDPIKLYKHLYDLGVVKFDLLANDAVVFQGTKGYSIKSLVNKNYINDDGEEVMSDLFSRVICFEPNEDLKKIKVEQFKKHN